MISGKAYRLRRKAFTGLVFERKVMSMKDNIRLNIGAFDSGIGGFSILKEIHRRLPALGVNYIADDAFAPYGTKSREQIIERSIENTKKLLDEGANLIVVACNSATAVAIEELRSQFSSIPIVGVEPYLNALNHPTLFPGIEKAGVITTVLTGKSEKFVTLKQKIDPNGIIQHWSLPHLAGYIENLYYFGMTLELEDKINQELQPMVNQHLSHLILGCTHYPLIAKLIEDRLKLITISPCPYVAARVESLLQQYYPDDFVSLNKLSQVDTFRFSSTKKSEYNQQYLFSSLSLFSKTP